MTIVYIGIYTLFLFIIWGFCVVAKIHAYKFKNFSNHIEKVTLTLLVCLGILSILGYVIIFSIGAQNTSYNINPSKSDSFSDIEY